MFNDYSEYIGINDREVVPEWAVFAEKISKYKVVKDAADAEKLRLKNIKLEKARLEKEKAK